MRLRWEVLVRGDRNAAQSAANEAISSCGGWIAGHAFMSDMITVLNFRVPANRIAELVATLAAADLKVTVDAQETRPENDIEVGGQLTLIFTSGNGDLRRDVPAFG